MNISKRVFAFEEREVDRFSRAEVSDLLDILYNQGINIEEFFLSEERLWYFRECSDKQKLREIKKVLIEKYDQTIRKEVAIKLSEKICEEEQDINFLINGVLEEVDKVLNSVCLCIIGSESIEDLYSSNTDCNFFEKILTLFGMEQGKDYHKKKEIEKEICRNLGVEKGNKKEDATLEL